MRFPQTDHVRPKAKVSKKRLKELISQMNGRCGYCGITVTYPSRGNTHCKGYDKRVIASTDHIVPLSKGGAHSPQNMICCCNSCNSMKANRDLSSFRVLLFNRKMGIPAFSSEQIAWLENNGFYFPQRYVAFFFEEAGFTFCEEKGLREGV